jgi:SAM-dependent methyltransferase
VDLASSPSKIELGCGANKRDGFFGIDIADGPAVDLVLDIEHQQLPFADDSIDHVYTSHAFEHLINYQYVLREIMRVCKPDAIVEIWTPYGKSNDGFLFGHTTFITETHFKHICYQYDRFYLGETPGYLNWERSQYVLFPGIADQLRRLGIPMDFALDHMFNIALEWGVFLRVKKDLVAAPGPQIPAVEFGYTRDQRVEVG